MSNLSWELQALGPTCMILIHLGLEIGQNGCISPTLSSQQMTSMQLEGFPDLYSLICVITVICLDIVAIESASRAEHYN